MLAGIRTATQWPVRKRSKNHMCSQGSRLPMPDRQAMLCLRPQIPRRPRLRRAFPEQRTTLRPPFALGWRMVPLAALVVCLATAVLSVAHAEPVVSADVVRQMATLDDGGSITDGVVSVLAQDATGYLWIGSPGGLLRYDGYRFRPFTYSAENPDSISGNFVRALLVARDGRLWVGTESDGLSSFDPKTERFTRFAHRADAPTSLQTGSVRALAEDADGRIWVGTTGGGLSRLNPASGEFTRIGLPNDDTGQAETRVSALIVSATNTLWVGTWSGLASVAAGSAIATRADTTRGEPVTTGGRNIQRLFQAEDGRIWAGSTDGNVIVFDELAGRATTLLKVDRDVTAIAQPSVDQVWVGHSGGIDIFDAAATHRIEAIRHQPGEADSLASPVVAALQFDRSGWVWIGTTGGGLQRLPIGRDAFALRRANLAGAAGSASFNVTSVLELADRQIWLGTGSNGIAVFSPDFTLLATLGLHASTRSAPREFVSSLAQTADGVVWAGAPDGLHGFWPDRKPFRDLPSSKWFGNATVRRLFAAPDDQLWIGTSDGLFLMPSGSHDIERVGTKNGAAAHVSVNAMTQDEAGRVWIGTAQGLYVIVHGDATMQIVEGMAGHEPAHASVLGLLLDTHQTLWLDTPEGVHRIVDFDGHRAAFDQVSMRLGVGGKPGGANLLEDGDGRIWTHKLVIDLARDRAYPLSPADGFDLGTGWFRSYAQTRDGRMLFGGRNGLLVVNPKKFKPWSYAPSLVASELRVNGARRPAADLAQSGLSLSPAERSFSIEFAALDFSAPGKNRYAYRLEGFDPDWIETDAGRRVASYSNLWPGHYVLHVRGSNRIGTWSPHQLRIPISVSPAWWQTWWFVVLVLAATGAVLVLFVRARVASVEHNRRLLENEVHARTRELHAVTRELAGKSKALEEASLCDPLTGLRNRRFLAQHLAADIALCLRRFEVGGRGADPAADDADIVFFLVDIDHFKQVNDLHGHAAGDTVLVQVAQRLLAVFRESDYVVRWGGEEFLIVARGTSRRKAAILAERVRQSIGECPLDLGTGASIVRTCSIGFAAFPFTPEMPRAICWERTIELTDLAMYAAKHAGRNGWVGLSAQPLLDPDRLDATKDALLAEIRDGTISVQTNLPDDLVRAVWRGSS